MSNLINNNELVKKFVALDSTEKTIKAQKEELKAQFLELARNENATFYYQGKENITSSVTVAPVTKKAVKDEFLKKYEEIQKQIDTLKAEQEKMLETVFSHYMVKVTKQPKGLNK